MRKKWHKLFETTLCVLYLVSLSDYNQKLYEDEEVNRMSENFQLFTHTANNPKLKDKPIIVIFNKLDIFTDKLAQRKDSISVAFADYTGDPYSVEDSIKFLESKFASTRENSEKIFFFTVTAINLDEMKRVFSDVKRIALEYYNK